MSGPRGDIARARQEAAAGWFTRLSQPAVTTEALRDFRDWRSDPENRQAYEQVEAVWSGAETLANDTDILALRGRVRHKVSDRRQRRERRWLVGLAGGAVLAAAATLAIGYATQPPSYRSGVGELRVIRLEDGSVLRLNTDSRAVVRYSPKTREVELERGQALFEVAHDTSRPFLVRANGATVRALGTVFDVKRAGREVDVVLIDGVVQVTTTSGVAQTLRPNQRLAVTGKTIQPPRPTDTNAATSWTQRRLTFEATPLGAAVAEVNRYSDHKVELAAADLRAAPVNGVFETGDTRSFADAVAQVFDLQVAEGRGGSLVLERPGAPAPGR